MKVFLALFLVLLPFATFAKAVEPADREEITRLFQRYLQVMAQHETDQLPNVFTERFLEREGGASVFEANLNSVPKYAVPRHQVEVIRQVGNQAAAKLIITQDAPSKTFFRVRKESGGWRIDGKIDSHE